MTANQTDDRPLANWQYRRVLQASLVQVTQRSTTNGNRQTFYSGSQTIVQRAPIRGGGTAGVTPAPGFEAPVIEWISDPGDELIVSNDEVLAGTPTVDGYVVVNPV